jgi:6-methylsalicylate decarboxylase
MTAPAGRIDVHHHLIPPAFTAVMDARGIKEVASTPLPKWTPDASLAVMDDCNIRTAITSLSAPGVYFGDRREARDLARACNEFAADMAVRHPGRFGNFAVLPMPFTDDACAEAIYALDVLKADGVVLLGSTEGKFLGDPTFEELMAELDRRQAIVFEHPNIHATSTQIDLAIPDFMVEFLCDTTRAATNLILSGTMERYSNIRWILSHAGGFLPFVAWRISLANNFPEFAEKAPQGVLTYIRRFYYDTALSPSPFAMAALRELVDPSHILFGSDFPFAPAPLVGVEVANLEALTIFDDATMAGIDRGHALGLFPRHALPGESVTQHRIGDQPHQGRLNRFAAGRAVKLVDWLRNR